MAITPYLYYRDVGGALKFLSNAFGFRMYGAQTLDARGKINHATMKLGDDLIMMGCPGSGYRNPKRLGQTTQSLYVNVDDVDAHFERAKKSGATILEEPADTITGTAVMVPRIRKVTSGISRTKSAEQGRSAGRGAECRWRRSQHRSRPHCRP